MKKLLVGLLVLIVVGGALAALFGERLLLRAMQRQVADNLSGARFADFADGLHVVLCGAGSPLPDPHRAGPCVAVVAGGRAYVVDAGSGAVRNLPLEGIAPGRVAHAFLTHFHSDHIDGLGELMLQRWAGGSHAQPLPVHGPTGVEEVVQGFNLAYRLDAGYRVAHHGEKIVPPGGAGGQAIAFAPPAPGEGLVVLEEEGLKVTAFAVDHAPVSPAVGYRFDYQGRSVVISGDTRKSDNVARFAQGADVLLHEALCPQLVEVMTAGAQDAHADNIAQITRDIHDYHTTPVEAAQVAAQAGVRQLVFYHLVPALPLRPLERVFVRGVSDVYRGGVTVARDGTWIALPANSTAVKVGMRR